MRRARRSRASQAIRAATARAWARCSAGLSARRAARSRRRRLGSDSFIVTTQTSTEATAREQAAGGAGLSGPAHQLPADKTARRTLSRYRYRPCPRNRLLHPNPAMTKRAGTDLPDAVEAKRGQRGREREGHPPPVPVRTFVLEPGGSSGDGRSGFRLSARGGLAQRPSLMRPRGMH